MYIDNLTPNKEVTPQMKKIILQILLIFLFASFCLLGFFVVRQALQMPFRSTNDTLHNTESIFNLDFLIPAGTHIDDRMTILEVIKIRIEKKKSLGKKIINSFPDLISVKYIYLSSLLLFLFWSFLCMTFLRIFTFVGYGRALRISMLLGSITYYFMPDFFTGTSDDIFFIGVALLIIIIRAYFSRQEKKRARLRM